MASPESESEAADDRPTEFIVVEMQADQTTRVLDPKEYHLLNFGDQMLFHRKSAAEALAVPFRQTPSTLPRDKAEKEAYLGRLALPLLHVVLGQVGEVIPNVDDPPDLFYVTDTAKVPVELTEVIYPVRHALNADLNRFSQALTEAVSVEEFSGYILTALLVPGPNGRVKFPTPRKFRQAIQDLVEALRDLKFLACTDGVTAILDGAAENGGMPATCLSFLRVCGLEKTSQTPDSPLSIMFYNATQHLSGEQLREVVWQALERKRYARVTGDRTVLILWSAHWSFRPLTSNISSLICDYILDVLRYPFTDVLYLHRSEARKHDGCVVMVDRTILISVDGESKALKITYEKKT